ncbi:hypothetical protein [Cytobacillus solani]|uniref:Uncharacterized protein n=1 Tax=Cytobacillus solani TaxID=1637975 RepID=A0A0Q3VIX0_9BACI|nr:hypothetical protein [Cytobacillus solani]KQL17666.1 hypothetical protein AN957_02915 [Cytobacillus solani]KQL20491.1 hypothetical protein AN957_19145 [Cytobacillus solani]
MGYIRHNSFVVTGDSYPEAQRKLDLAHEKAVELFSNLVSPVIQGKTNGYQSFFVAPDGSKEGWDLSDEYDEKRKQLADFIDSLAYGDGSNCVQFVDVGFDECYEAEVDRTNKKRPEED